MAKPTTAPSEMTTTPFQWGEELWRHSDPTTTYIHTFLYYVNKVNEAHTSFPWLNNYADLHAWSIEHPGDFWACCWHFLGVRHSTRFNTVVDGSSPMFPRPNWFAGAKLNFAENLLYPRCGIDGVGEDTIAILAATETLREEVTWRVLRERVRACQAGLRRQGVTVGDVVAGYVGNHVNAVVAMLAAASLGAVWTGVSPDSGVGMVVERLRQIGVKVLFCDDGQVYNGKRFEIGSKVREVLDALDGVQACVIFDVVGAGVEAVKGGKGCDVIGYADFCVENEDEKQKEMEFVQLEADHPVYVLYSSGTTGAPKCIVHGAIGTLLQHKKEHILHCDIKPGERVFYYTTATWMMWHWLISALASGATIVLYDGSPMRYISPPPSTETSHTTSKSAEQSTTSYSNSLAMPLLLSELKVAHFGTSARFLSILEQASLFPKLPPYNIDLSCLRAIYNTASPLAPSTFRYVYKAFGPDIMLASITGGTDIISLFGAGVPILPVHAGEITAPGLGMSVRAFSPDGKDITSSGQAGDLVCTVAFPSQPIAFWGKDGEAKYRASYFAHPSFPGIWHHGDYVAFNPTTGGMLMLGRSDGVLNPAGVRFGSAEIYNVLLAKFAGRISDGLCVGRRRAGEVDEEVVLFVKMEDGVEFDDALVKEIKGDVRTALSARHCPSVISECDQIPVTVNGKKIESVVKGIISGTANGIGASVANPECLEWYKEWAERN